MDIDGQELKARRKAAGLSLRELATRSGVHYTTVGMIERGARQAHGKTMRKLVAALERNTEREAFIAGFNAHRHLPDDTTVAEAYERWRQGRDG